jgi:hypothetical protein
MSFEAESFDIKVDSCTQENQWDITKLLDRMSTCPFVKVRGLAARDSKARRKKLKTLSRFEVFVWFTILTIIHFLRTLTTLLYNLLIRAGDVELNPGPGPPQTTASPIPDENGPSSASTPKDSDQVTPIGDEPVHGLYMKPVPVGETSPNGLSAVDRTKPDTPLPSKDLQEAIQLFEEEGGGDVVSESLSTSSAIEYPFSQAEQLKEKPKMNGSDITNLTRKKESAEAVIGAGSVTTEAVQPPAGDDEKTDVADSQPRSMKRLSLQQTASPKSIASETRKQSKKQVFQQQVESDVVEVVLNKEPVDEDTIAKDFMDFFVKANKRYRSGEKCSVCPICLKFKKERGGQRKSHVIPKSILKYYREIHSTSKQTDYILDFSRDERLAAGSLTYQLLCDSCETKYSVTEEQLLHLYLYLGANSNTDVIITHKDKNVPSWIKYILANILFRGILTNIDLDERFQGQNIINEIYFLWKFCSGKLEAISKQCSPPNLKVFLLSNEPFCSTLDNFMYPFEMLLRMPRCTELIRQKEVGTFFYTKFDSIHVVLPLCKTSRDYFDTFNNGLMIEDCILRLRWSIHPKADITRQGKLISFSYPPECANLKDHFPEVLLKWCTSLYEEFVSRLHNHPRPRYPFLAGIERYRGAKYVGFDVKERMQQADALKCELLDERASLTTSFEEQCKLRNTQLNEYVLIASRQSPLRRRVQEELEQLKEVHVIVNAELSNTKRELGETREELGSTRNKLEKKEQELETNERQIATLETKLSHQTAKVSYQNEKLDTVRFDLFSSRAELTASKSENATLREELASERETSKYHCQIHQERFRQTKFLYMTTLRQKRDQVWLIDQLKEVINDMANEFEYLMEVTQGSSLHQIYEELCDECKKLLVLKTPPNSPISIDHAQLK